MLLIGSTALIEHGFNRTPKDIDLVATFEDAQKFIKATSPSCHFPINDGKSIYCRWKDGTICEIEVAWEGSKAALLLDFIRTNADVAIAGKKFVKGLEIAFPGLEVLYLLKMSHRYLKNSPHFAKTMADILEMRGKGVDIPVKWLPFFRQLEKLTYTYPHPKLDVDNKNFFDTTVTGVHQEYDHDSIHEAVAYLGKPAYLFYKPEDSEVNCSQEMFFSCDYTTRLFGVVEEAQVLALERSLIPYPNGKTADEAFLYALMKVCTSITSGWFREFAWENYHHVVFLYRECQHHHKCYTERFRQAVADGRVKKKQQTP